MDTIPCACNCGASIPRVDSRNRPRKFVLGHSQTGRKRPEQAAVLLRVRQSPSGPAHPRWTGNTPYLVALRHSPKYNEWRKAVYRRDNWTCQRCKIKQKHPIAHHIKSFTKYPIMRFDINNGMTVCRSCHKTIHQEIQFTWKIKNA